MMPHSTRVECRTEIPFSVPSINQSPPNQIRIVPARNAEQAYQLTQTAQPTPRPRWAAKSFGFFRILSLGRARKGEKMTDQTTTLEKIETQSSIIEKNRPRLPPPVQKFEQSPAFVAHHEGLIRALERTTAPL